MGEWLIMYSLIKNKMLEFKKEIINGSFNKVNRTSKESDFANVNIKLKDKNIDINFGGKGLLAAGVVAVAPTAICVLGATIAVCAITKAISKREKDKEKEPKDKISE